MSATDDNKAAEISEDLDSESQGESQIDAPSPESDSGAELHNEEDTNVSSEEETVAELPNEDESTSAEVEINDGDSSPKSSKQDEQNTSIEDAPRVDNEVETLDDSGSDKLEDEPPEAEEETIKETPEEPVMEDDSELLDDSSETEVSAQSDPGIASPDEPDEKDDSPVDEPIVSFLSKNAAEPEEDGQLGESESPENEDGREWYVVHCYSGYENKVRHNLEQRIESMGMKNLIFDVVVPTEEEIEVKDGKRRTVERRVFPGYILINMVLGEESWYVVRNTPGVTSFVGMGEEPTPLRPEEVTQIIKRMESDAPRIKVTFKQGERVRIVDGPFNDFRGTVNEIDMERAKVRVMVNFFGRDTPVELDFLQVEKS